MSVVTSKQNKAVVKNIDQFFFLHTPPPQTEMDEDCNISKFN